MQTTTARLLRSTAFAQFSIVQHRTGRTKYRSINKPSVSQNLSWQSLPVELPSSVKRSARKQPELLVDNEDWHAAAFADKGTR